MTNPFTNQAELGGNRMIQLGCGAHPLHSPWESYDQEVDIAEPLPFPDNCAAFIHAEHVIEHIPFRAGVDFLKECYRVLQPGGVLRLAFPDCERFLACLGLGEEPYEYLNLLHHLKRPHRNTLDVLQFILCENGHQSAWTSMIGLGALHAAGFIYVEEPAYGDSIHAPLVDIDRHHFSVPRAVVLSETTILEGTK